MKYIFGNLISMGLNGDFDVICQGCNIYNTMGGGLSGTDAAAGGDLG